MATEYLFSNNATTTLAQSVSATATVINVASGTGSLFPSPSSGQAFAVTLVDAATGLTNEICYCTSRSGDQLTVVRGREGTNAIAWSAGDTCANYITADVMESWLQESDLNGYATQTWSSSQFVGRGASVYDFTPLQLGVNKASGQVWTSYTDASGNIKYAFSQPAGDYATNPALQSVNTNLQNQINNRVIKTGDTSTGTQVARNKYDNGTLHWSPGWSSVISGMSGGSSNGEYSFGMWAQTQDSAYTAGILSLNGFQGRKDFRFNEDGNIFTPLGTVALESDISNLQNQINGKQPAGNYQPAGSYVTTDTYTSDFSTSDDRVINLPYDNRIEVFTTTASAGDIVTFPRAFSSVQGCICHIQGNSDYNVKAFNVTNTGFTLHINSGGSNAPLVVFVKGKK